MINIELENKIKDKRNNWLALYSKNIASQSGEDGVIEKIFEIVKGNNWCVEFGAWDGKYLSNTWNLITNKGWSAVLIEANKKKYQQLIRRYRGNNRVTCFNKLVEFSNENTLDYILSNTPISQSFDLLSIDIDGNDYHIWDSMKKYNPKVVIIEFNPTIPNDIEFIQPKNMKINQGSSLLSLVKLGKKKGYEIITTIGANAFFIKNQYFGLFGIKNDPLSLLYYDKEVYTRIFQLFDGTLVLDGCDTLIWHRKKINQKKIQVLPKFLRRIPPIHLSIILRDVKNRVRRKSKRFIKHILNFIFFCKNIIFFDKIVEKYKKK